MSLNQTNHVDPGDSATDLTSNIQDETNEDAQPTFGVAGHTATAPVDNGDALFPGQTADEQNLEVDVCCLVRSNGEYAPLIQERDLRYTHRTISRVTQGLVVTRSSVLLYEL